MAEGTGKIGTDPSNRSFQRRKPSIVEKDNVVTSRSVLDVDLWSDYRCRQRRCLNMPHQFVPMFTAIVAYDRSRVEIYICICVCVRAPVHIEQYM